MRCKQHNTEACIQCFGAAGAAQAALTPGTVVHDIVQTAIKLHLDPERTLYVSAAAEMNADSFIISNEFHWRGLSPQHDRITTDVVISAGSNAGWDLVLENNARALVVLDYAPAVHQAHEWLFRPLMLTSRGPAEFLSWLFCMPAMAADAKDVLVLSKDWFSAAKEPLRAQLTHEFHQIILKTVSAAASANGISEVALGHLADYFQCVCAARKGGCAAAKYPFNLGHFQWALAGGTGDFSGVLASHICDRYLRPTAASAVAVSAAGVTHTASAAATASAATATAAAASTTPASALTASATPASVAATAASITPAVATAASATHTAGFRVIDSWLSSAANFGRLRSVFAHHLYYAVVDLYHPMDTMSWTRLGDVFKFSRITVNVSNIVDAVYDIARRSRRQPTHPGLAALYTKIERGFPLPAARLEKCVEIDTYFSRANPLLSSIVFYYTTGGLNHGDHVNEEYIHFSGIDVAFGGLP